MNQEMQTGISGNLSASVNAEAQRNVYSRSSTNSQLIRPNETIQTTNPVNQRSQRAGYSGNLTSYFPRQFNFTRNKRKRNCKDKGSNIKGNRYFYKEIVLLTGLNDTRTPRQGTKLYLKQNQHIVRGVQFSKEWLEQQVIEQVKSLFGSKLSNYSFEFLESVYTQLVSPTLPPGEAFNGMMFYTNFRDKIVYVRPQDQVVPLPPPVTKSKKKARASQDSDESTASEFGTERSAGEDDEISRIRGLFTSESSSTTAVDSIPETSLSESLVSQSSNQHINSNNTVRVQEILPVDSIPESS